MKRPPLISLPDKPKYDRQRKIVIVSLLFILVLPVLLVAGRLAYSKHQVKSEISRIRSVGLPADWSDLWDFYPDVEDERNAALQLGPMLEQLDFGDKSNEMLPLLGAAELGPIKAPLNDEAKRTTAELLDRNSDVLSRMEVALELPGSRYPLIFTDGFAMLLPHLPKLRSAVELLQLKMLFELSEGENEKAFNTLVHSLLLERTIHDEPTLISYLVLLRMNETNTRSLEYFFSHDKLSEPELESLAEFTDEQAFQNSHLRALISERAFGIGVFRNKDGLNAFLEDSASGTGELAVRTLGHLSGDFAFYVDTMEEIITTIQKGPNEPLRTADLIRRKFEIQGKFFIFSRMMLPALDKVPTLSAKGHARLRAVKVAIAVENYRLNHDAELPETLSRLLPDYLDEIPVDPFSNEQLIYAINDEGYIVYSVGEDRADNLGVKAVNSGPDVPPGDIPFTVAR